MVKKLTVPAGGTAGATEELGPLKSAVQQVWLLSKSSLVLEAAAPSLSALSNPPCSWTVMEVQMKMHAVKAFAGAEA